MVHSGAIRVKPPKMNLEETPSGSTVVPPQTLWNTVLTATPVVLTVLATVLAGLSSRELTLSQYHRALAAQNQSKAGDQWNFFQAKRSRRTNHENTADLLQVRAESGKADAAAAEAHARLLVERLRRADTEIGRLLNLLGSTTPNQGPAAAALQQAAVRLQQTVREKVTEAETVQTRMQEVFARNEVRSGWAFLIHNERPKLEIT